MGRLFCLFFVVLFIFFIKKKAGKGFVGGEVHEERKINTWVGKTVV